MIFDMKIKPSLFREGIKASVLELLVNNKGQFFTVKQLKERVLEERPFVYDYRCILYLAFGTGLTGRITSSIHALRGDGHPIVSSAEQGKGYCYINPNGFMSPDYWDSKFFANEKREDIPKAERKIDQELFVRCLQKCENPEIRKRMKVVASAHGISIEVDSKTEEEKIKKKEEDEDDE